MIDIFTLFSRTKVIKISIFFALVILIPLTSSAQLRSSYWTKYKNEIFFGASASTYLGDLGGGIESGKHSLADLNMAATKFAFSAGFRTKLTEMVTFRMDLAYGQCSGADSLTENLGRKSRNLSFKTTYYTFSPLIEVYVIPESYGRGASPISAYISTGLRFMYFNPQAEYQGTWYNLQPLGTEGQLVNSGSTSYSQFTVGLPFIAGFKFALPSKGGKSGAWSLGVEASATWLMTDYFDDVSTTYADPEAIKQISGEIGAILADRRANGGQSAGGIRGNPQYNDWYGLLTVMVSKQLYTKSRRRKSPNRGSYF